MYEFLEKAQADWVKAEPYAVNHFIEQAAEIMIKRSDELVEWLVNESGSTVINANVEVNVCISVINACC